MLFHGNYNPKDTDLFDYVIGLPFDTPTLRPTSWPTMWSAAGPTAGEAALQTAVVSSDLDLEGMSAADFTADVQLSIREASAAEYGVHIDQVTVSILADEANGRRLASGDQLRVQVDVRCLPSRMDALDAKMDQIRQSATKRLKFTERLNTYLRRDVEKRGVKDRNLVLVIKDIVRPIIRRTRAPTPAPSPVINDDEYCCVSNPAYAATVGGLFGAGGMHECTSTSLDSATKCEPGFDLPGPASQCQWVTGDRCNSSEPTPAPTPVLGPMHVGVHALGPLLPVSERPVVLRPAGIHQQPFPVELVAEEVVDMSLNKSHHDEACAAGVVVDCQVEAGWQWSACDVSCGEGHSTRSRTVIVEAW
jgi:hypothetical protein